MQGLDNAGVELKFSDVLGDLELGQLTEEYYKDADLREILLNTALDPDKMASLEGHHLLLVTSVVYSTKFVLQGSRMHQVLLVQSNPVYTTPLKSSDWTNLKNSGFAFYCGTEYILKATLFENDDVTIIITFPCPSFAQTQG